jgi:sirohydrochlorin cobaltochelatase
MKRAIVLFGHGSRDPAWRRPMDAVAAAIRSRDPDTAVVCAFLEFTDPDLPSAIAELARSGVTAIRVLPMFLGVGTHARADLPKLIAIAQERAPDLLIEVAPAVGEHEEVVQLLAEIALRRTA